MPKPANIMPQKPPPPPRKPGKKSLAAFLKDFDYDNLEDMMDVVTVTMAGSWLMFVSKKLFSAAADGVGGKRPMPMPGPILLVNLVSEEYVVTVFTKVRFQPTLFSFNLMEPNPCLLPPIVQ